MASIDYSRPHPDAVLCRTPTGEVRPYPTGRPRDVAEDVSDAKAVGFVVSVPVVRTEDGIARMIPIEAHLGGPGAVERVLRQRRKHKGEDVPARMLASEWERMSDKQRAALMVSKSVAIDPRDARIAELEAQLRSKTVAS